jgi:hypothetical protein
MPAPVAGGFKDSRVSTKNVEAFIMNQPFKGEGSSTAQVS